MITYGFYPAPIDYSIFVTDWHNALVAILLLVSGVIIGHMANAWSLRPVLRPNDALPALASPSIGDSVVEDGDFGQPPRAQAAHELTT